MVVTAAVGLSTSAPRASARAPVRVAVLVALCAAVRVAVRAAVRATGSAAAAWRSAQWRSACRCAGARLRLRLQPRRSAECPGGHILAILTQSTNLLEKETDARGIPVK